LAVTPKPGLNAYRVRVKTPSTVVADQRFPLVPPDNGHLYQKAKDACDRHTRIDYIELQEHANHTGIPAAMAASRAAKALLESAATDHRALRSLANACYRIGDFEQAAALAERILATNAHDLHGNHVKGMIAYEKGALATAESFLAKTGPAANYVRALMALADNDRRRALALLREMVQHRPKVYRPRMLLAWLLAASGQAEEATGLAKTLTRENMASPEAFETLARVASRSADKRLAQEAATARDALLKNNPDAERQLGLFRDELDHGRWAYVARFKFPLPHSKP
jgi:tetratricopeptide (TPR) repeat protein